MRAMHVVCFWRCRFANYPQEILFKLEHPSKVQQVQILSHEYKVCSACASPGSCKS